MINPQSYSKNIGRMRKKLNLNAFEMIIPLWLMPLSSFCGLSKPYLPTLITLLLIVFKNSFFKKGQILNTFTKQEILITERINVKRNK